MGSSDSLGFDYSNIDLKAAVLKIPRFQVFALHRALLVEINTNCVKTKIENYHL